MRQNFSERLMLASWLYFFSCLPQQQKVSSILLSSFTAQQASSLEAYTGITNYVTNTIVLTKLTVHVMNHDFSIILYFYNVLQLQLIFYFKLEKIVKK